MSLVQPDLDGPAAPPRSNGEMVFEAPWEARAFAVAVTLLEREGLGWDDFRPHLVAAIAARPGEPYYESFVAALESFVADTLRHRRSVPGRADFARPADAGDEVPRPPAG